MSAQSPETFRVSTYLTALQHPLALAMSNTLSSFSLSTLPLKMSSKSLTLVVFIAFLVWSSNFEACIARRGKHWRQNRDASASLSKKKGSHGGSKNHHSGAPPSPLPPKPKEEIVQTPPKKGPSAGDSAIFNVLDFGAKGNGETDDTKVPSILPIFNLFSYYTMIRVIEKE